MRGNISIVGAGLVGSLAGLILKRRGFDVQLFEKRSDPRRASVKGGRSINLALSGRGIKALKMADVFDRIAPYLIPMKGRMMHSQAGELTFQSYGKEEQCIYSVSRAQLNGLLIEEAEKEGVQIEFDKVCEDVDFEERTLHFADGSARSSDLILGTDGAFSAVRKKLQQTDRFNFSQYYIEHGYKELTIEPVNDDFQLAPNYLHIWPRGNFMLIALPNCDKTFTCTLFFPFEGTLSFESLSTEAKVTDFFSEYFPDAVALMPDLVGQFFNNPTSSLVTTRCNPWNKGRTVLLGDAAHAIVPFYGQGMNSGFEDVSLFIEMAEASNWDWDAVLPRYATSRKKDADAISELALSNFIEMRDHVADPSFLRRKKLESEIHDRFPNDWIPLYSMVTFSDMPYAQALRLGQIQKALMDEVLKKPAGEEIDYKQLIKRFNALKQAG